MFSNDLLATPSQKKSTPEKYAKDQEWFKKTMDSYEYQALYYEQEAHRKMNVFYELDNGEIDQTEMERVFNPLGLSNATFPSSIKHYPVGVPKIDLLVGEESKRRFNWSVRSKNPESESSEVDTLLDMFMEIAMEQIQKADRSEEDIQKEIEKYAKYAKYSFKDLNEITSTKILQYLWRKQTIQYQFNKGFRHALVGGRELYRIDVEGEEPILYNSDPRNVFVIKRGDSEHIENAEAVIEITYEPIGRIVDSFYDWLDSKDITEIEKGSWKTNSRGSKGVLNYDNKLPPIYSNLDFGNGQGFIDINEFNAFSTFKLGLPYDYQGNCRVVRARWIGRKKIGIVTFFDDNGDEDEKIVSEFYKIDKEAGESIEWLWVNEAYEGTKIADSIYLKMQPRTVQMGHMDNKSKCFLGYIGTDYGKSLMARMESYQYAYDVYMNKLEQIFAKYKGPIYELDISKIPDEWEMDMWMYYADTMGWAVIDPMNEGKKGAAMGKLAGGFNTTGKVLDPKIGDYIQQTIGMLQYIEKQIGTIAGVSEQRQGQIDNRETAQGIERSVTQSSHITEKWFFLHDDTKKRALAALLDTAKQVWSKQKSKRLPFIMDDMSREFIEFNGADFASTEQDIFISDSYRDDEIRQMMKSLGQAYIQNGMGSIMVDLIQTNSIAEMNIMLKEAEAKILEQQQQAQQQQSADIEKQIQQQAAENDAQLQFKYDELASKERIEFAKLNKEVEESDTEQLEGNELDETFKFQSELNLKRDQLSEIVRHNKSTESIAKNKPKSTSK